MCFHRQEKTQTSFREQLHADAALVTESQIKYSVLFVWGQHLNVLSASKTFLLILAQII